jgi:hypothetical protein
MMKGWNARRWFRDTSQAVQWLVPDWLPLGKIAEHKAKLVIIEPLAAFLAGPDAINEIRRVLCKLSKIVPRGTLAPGLMVCYPCRWWGRDAWSPIRGASGCPLQP